MEFSCYTETLALLESIDAVCPTQDRVASEPERNIVIPQPPFNFLLSDFPMRFHFQL